MGAIKLFVENKDFVRIVSADWPKVADDLPAKHLNDYEDMQFDYVVTLCEQVVGSCLDFARDGHSMNWYCRDPASETGPEAARMEAFRQAREEIRAHLNTWLADEPV